MIMTLLDNTITGRTSSSYCGSLWFNFLGGLLTNTLPPSNHKSNGPSLRCYQVLQLFM